MNVFPGGVFRCAKLSLPCLLAVSHPEEPGILEIARQLIDAARVTRRKSRSEREAGHSAPLIREIKRHAPPACHAQRSNHASHLA